MRPEELRLNALIKQWDASSKYTRKRILDQFLQEYSSGDRVVDMERELGSSASLFLSRISSWLRITCCKEKESHQTTLHVISLFITGSPNTRFLLEFLQVGGLATLLQLLKTTLDERIRQSILKIIRHIGSGGRSFKENICDNHGIEIIVEIAEKASSDQLRDVLIHLGFGNPNNAERIQKGLIQLLNVETSETKLMATYVSRQLLEKTSIFYTPAASDVSLFLPICFKNLQHPDLHVEYESLQLLRVLARTDVVKSHDAILSCLLEWLKTSVPVSDPLRAPKVIACRCLEALMNLREIDLYSKVESSEIPHALLTFVDENTLQNHCAGRCLIRICDQMTPVSENLSKNKRFELKIHRFWLKNCQNGRKKQKANCIVYFKSTLHPKNVSMH